jgi:hypothetical protein
LGCFRSCDLVTASHVISQLLGRYFGSGHAGRGWFFGSKKVPPTGASRFALHQQTLGCPQSNPSNAVKVRPKSPAVQSQHGERAYGSSATTPMHTISIAPALGSWRPSARSPPWRWLSLRLAAGYPHERHQDCDGDCLELSALRHSELLSWRQKRTIRKKLCFPARAERPLRRPI